MRPGQIIVSCILVIIMVGVVFLLFRQEMGSRNTKKATSGATDVGSKPAQSLAPPKPVEPPRPRTDLKKLAEILRKEAEANLDPEDLKMVAEAKAAFNKDIHDEEKIEILEGLIGIAHPDVIEIVQKALNSKNSDVRLAAVELLEDFENELILPAVEKALYDKNAEVRETAMNSLMYVESPDATNLLVRGVDDKSEDIREITFDILEDRDQKIKEEVFESAIRSRHSDVKERVLEMIVDIPSHKTMDILINGMRSNDKETREEIISVIDFFVSEEFESYEEAVDWWKEHKDDFDDELFEKD